MLIEHTKNTVYNVMPMDVQNTFNFIKQHLGNLTLSTIVILPVLMKKCVSIVFAGLIIIRNTMKTILHL